MSARKLPLWSVMVMRDDTETLALECQQCGDLVLTADGSSLPRIKDLS
jgi:hypothetical protein